MLHVVLDEKVLLELLTGDAEILPGEATGQIVSQADEGAEGV
jgi:hypothetical protein